MLKKKILLVSMLGLIGFLDCFGNGTVNPDNEVEFGMDNIRKVIISYDMENIDFYRSEGEKLIVKEFMSSNKSRYYANVSRQSDTVKISEGRKPLLDDSFTRRVEVYLPRKTETLELTVTTTGGEISMNRLDLKVKSFFADTTSGIIRINSVLADSIKLSTTRGDIDLGSITAGSIRLDNTSGEVKCRELTGRVVYISTNGSIHLENANGEGSYIAGSSGILDIKYQKITGDIEMRSKNKDVNLALPSSTSFRYDLKSKNGEIMTDFLDSREGCGNESRGIKGDAPEFRLRIETTNGDIRVTS